MNFAMYDTYTYMYSCLKMKVEIGPGENSVKKDSRFPENSRGNVEYPIATRMPLFMRRKREATQKIKLKI